MRGIAVYMEGGGDTAEGKASLRRGMGEFLGALRDAARAKRLHWKIVACGRRQDAFDAFRNAVGTAPDTFNVLLVDSEDAVTSAPPSHLQGRDGWTFGGVAADQVQLMVRTMETWIVADPDALAEYYGTGFNAKPLPKAKDLETVDKTSVVAALSTATKNTTKGVYHKLRHASDLLERIDTAKAKQRCKHCRRFFDAVEARIGSA